MSQFVRAITACDTGDRKLIDSFSPLFREVFDLQQSIEDVTTTDIRAAKVYKIEVRLGSEVLVTEHSEIPDAIRRVKQSVIEACFGEFREDFYRIQNAIYNRDFQKARSLVTDLQQRMYDVD